MRRCLGAEETDSIEIAWRKPILNLSLAHEVEKLSLVNGPVAFVSLERLKDVICRRKQRLVDVFCVANFSQKKRQVICFCEPSELGSVMQSHIEHLLDIRPAYPLKKVRGRGFCEADSRHVCAIQRLLLHLL